MLPDTTHVTLAERADWLLSMIGGFLDAPIPESVRLISSPDQEPDKQRKDEHRRIVHGTARPMHDVMAGYVERGVVPGIVTLVSQRRGVHREYSLAHGQPGEDRPRKE